MRKLAAAIALLFTMSFPHFALAQLSVDGSGLTATGGAAYGEQAPEQLNFGTFVGRYIIRPIIGLTGVIFLILTVYAGFLWMTSAGEAKQIDKAKNILIAAVMGTVIVVSAYVITNTVISSLSTAT